MKRSLILAASLLLAGAALLRADEAAVKQPSAGVYKFDTVHSQLGFRVTHMVVSSVNGKFDTFEGTVVVKPSGSISVEADADAASIDTGNSMRDAHLRGSAADKPKDDFFYAAKYPKLTFKSGKVVLDGRKLTVTGDLTIRGVTKDVTFEGTYNGDVTAMGGEHIGATLSTVINRRDFGLKFAYAVEAGPVVGNMVTLNLDVDAVKDGPKKK